MNSNNNLPENNNDSYKKLALALTKISGILNSALDLENILDLILNELESLMNYDKALILFLDGDMLSYKASRNIDIKSCNINKISILNNNTCLSEIIRSGKTLISDVENIKDSSIIKELGLNFSIPFSFIISPLTIRDTIFGLTLLIKEKENFFTNEDKIIIEAFSSSAAYAVKDAELSNVFKMQLKILQDNVIERTKALELIKEQNIKILESDKIKNEFLANISHELRTPLNAIIGFSEALTLKIFGELNPKQEEYVKDIHSSGIHLLGMINDLLDLSKIEAKKMKLNKSTFNANLAVNEVINIVKALADKKKLSINLTKTDKKVEINADFQNFQQIMYNLLSNAIKFTNDGGNIEVQISTKNGYVKISVKDNGIGIDPKFHEKIFEKFQQVDNSYTRKQGSTGLGLTITKKLVELHQGEIKIESQLNKGAKFTFTIPIASTN